MPPRAPIADTLPPPVPRRSDRRGPSQEYAMSILADIQRNYHQDTDDDYSLFKRTCALVGRRALDTTDVVDRGVDRNDPTRPCYTLRKELMEEIESVTEQMQQLIIVGFEQLQDAQGVKNYVVDPKGLMLRTLRGTFSFFELQTSYDALLARIARAQDTFAKYVEVYQGRRELMSPSGTDPAVYESLEEGGATFDSMMDRLYRGVPTMKRRLNSDAQGRLEVGETLRSILPSPILLKEAFPRRQPESNPLSFSYDPGGAKTYVLDRVEDYDREVPIQQAEEKRARIADPPVVPSTPAGSEWGTKVDDSVSSLRTGLGTFRPNSTVSATESQFYSAPVNVRDSTTNLWERFDSGGSNTVIGAASVVRPTWAHNRFPSQSKPEQYGVGEILPFRPAIPRIPPDPGRDYPPHLNPSTDPTLSKQLGGGATAPPIPTSQPSGPASRFETSGDGSPFAPTGGNGGVGGGSGSPNFPIGGGAGGGGSSGQPYGGGGGPPGPPFGGGGGPPGPPFGGNRGPPFNGGGGGPPGPPYPGMPYGGNGPPGPPFGGGGGGGPPGPPYGGAAPMGYPPYFFGYDRGPSIKQELKPEQLPEWDGSYDSAILYFHQLQEFAALGGNIPERMGFWLWQTLKPGSAVAGWYTALPSALKQWMRGHYLHYVEAIRHYFLGRDWQQYVELQYQQQSFRQTGHENESPHEFIMRRILYTRMLLQVVPDSHEEVYYICRKNPTAWESLLVRDHIPNTATLQLRMRELEMALVDAWAKSRGNVLTTDNLVSALQKAGVSLSTNRTRPPFSSFRRCNPTVSATAHHVEGGIEEYEEGEAEEASAEDLPADEAIIHQAFASMKRDPPPSRRGPFPFSRRDEVNTSMPRLPAWPCKACGSKNHWDKECPHWDVFQAKVKQAKLVEKEDDPGDSHIYSQVYQALRTQYITSNYVDKRELAKLSLKVSARRVSSLPPIPEEGTYSQQPRASVEEVEDEDVRAAAAKPKCWTGALMEGWDEDVEERSTLR